MGLGLGLNAEKEEFAATVNDAVTSIKSQADVLFASLSVEIQKPKISKTVEVFETSPCAGAVCSGIDEAVRLWLPRAEANHGPRRAAATSLTANGGVSGDSLSRAFLLAITEGVRLRRTGR
jgi:hypothetical protein